MTTPRIEENLIKHLVDRFLGWKLPADFHPDAGISFKPTFNDTPEIMQALGLAEPMHHEPTGTNLFTAEQAKEMFRFLLENDDGTSILAEFLTQAHQAGIDEAVEKQKREELTEVEIQNIVIETIGGQYQKRFNEYLDYDQWQGIREEMRICGTMIFRKMKEDLELNRQALDDPHQSTTR